MYRAAYHPHSIITGLRRSFSEFAQSRPARFTLTVFSLLIFLFTSLLFLPAATPDGQSTTLVDALFTAVSAICVTGLSTVDMAEHWSPFGDAIILLAVQVGGIGVLTFASILGVAVAKRLGLKQRLLAASDTNPMRAHQGPVAESQAVDLGQIQGLLGAILISVVTIEVSLIVLIFPHLLLLGEDPLPALWHSIYLAISSYTNTGFVPYADGMARFAHDGYLLTVLGVGVFLGSVGFPVVFALYNFALRRRWRKPHLLSLHTKLTLVTTGVLMVAGMLVLLMFEWNNPSTLGEQSAGEKMLSALFLSTMTRSGGISVLDMNELNGASLLMIDMLMFVGGGSAATSGGIKVTTLAVLFLAAFAEARGYKDIQAFGRRIPTEVLRVSVSIVLWAATIIAAATLALLTITGESLDRVLFEVISAFGTCGLSTGLTGELPDSGKIVLVLTMWAGRVGTVTLAAAVAASSRPQYFRRPEERPIVG